MEISKSIRNKFFIFFLVMGIVPFIILIVFGSINIKADMENGMKQTSLLYNMIISEHVTGFVEKNLAVLHSLALVPELINYVNTGDEAYRAMVEKLCRDTNAIFKDESFLAVTARDAQQIFRTDGSTLVNIKERAHYQEAMKGREYISDILPSKSTGKMIVVMEVPVLNGAGEPVGLVQRNFNLESLQDLISNLDDSETSIIVMDRNGRVIVNSDDLEGVGSEYAEDSQYKALIDKIYNSVGVLDLTIEGEECMVAYARNFRTGWLIMTIRPYHFVMDEIYQKAFYALLICGVMLTLIAMIAWQISFKISDPIVKMTDAVDKIASGADVDAVQISVSTNDELGQMAAAFNKIRHDREKLVENLDKVQLERDDFKLASEMDKLTDLFNKKTMENLCRMKLQAFNEINPTDKYIALYIVDLDHFKDVNDLLGHQFGDKVLVEFASGLRKIFRTNDCIGRFGGDEFVVIIDNIPNLNVIQRKAEQIRKLAFELNIDGKGKFVTASIGIAIAPYDGRDYETLFRVADEEVYWVKRNGKNNYRCKHFLEDDHTKTDDGV